MFSSFMTFVIKYINKENEQEIALNRYHVETSEAVHLAAGDDRPSSAAHLGQPSITTVELNYSRAQRPIT